MGISLVSRFGKDRVAIAFPLGGLVLLWLFVVAAQFADLYVRSPWNYSGGYLASAETVHASIYLFLAGFAALGIASVFGKRLAFEAGDTPLAKSARGFTLLAVIVSLILGAIFGLANFLNGFNGNVPNGTMQNEFVRIFNLYVPILLAAGLLVFIILKAFVGQHKEVEND